MPVIDLHCHVLAGIDDGPRTIEDSLAVVHAAAANGTRTIVATPHVSRRYPNANATIAQLTADLNQRLTVEGVPLDIRPGAEIAMTRLLDLDPAQLWELGLGGGSWLLIEPPFTAVATGFDIAATNLMDRGHRIVIAHPERCPAFHNDPSTLTSLVRAGALTSITAGALVGRFGEPVRRFALHLAEEDMVHNVASDAHDHLKRSPSISTELDQAGLGPLADWLTQAVPAAILDDDTIPPRPAINLAGIGREHSPQPRRRGWLGARR
jgi:protein-tyrosine phosphatase